MTELLIAQSVVNGLILGAIYVLTALGLTLLYGIMHIVNFAHGEIYMLGAFACYFMVTKWGVNYFLSLPIVMIVLAIIGILLERIFFRPVREKFIQCLLVTLGLSNILQSLGWTFFGTLDKSIPTPFSRVIKIGFLFIPQQRLFAAVIGLVLAILLYLLVQRTKIGRYMRAVEQDSEAASLFGVSINRVNIIAFGIACAMAGLAGALMGPVFVVNPAMGYIPLLNAFTIVILGGLGSIIGCVLGGFTLGMIESLAGILLGTELAYGVIFAILILIIIVKPSGFMGHA
jgi:branched-chain amino acid transport system permease protein